MDFDRDRYLERIGLDACAPTRQGLDALLRAQLAAMPFEDIDPYLGQVPNLAPDAVWRKLVDGRRGGYCFELNALFGRALEAFGFAFRPILARVRMGMLAGGPRAHLAWIVRVDGEDLLADAGFGGPGPCGALAPVVGTEPDLGDRRFRFRRDPATGEVVLDRWSGAGWFALYGYTEAPFSEVDVEGANFLCSRWPALPFVDNLMISVHRDDTHVTLMNRALKVDGPAGVVERTLRSRADLADTLVGAFGLGLDRQTVDAIWSRLDAAATGIAA